MFLIVLAVGIVVAFAGAMLILSGVPVLDVTAAAVFVAGIVMIVGGLILMALALVVRTLSRIAERMEMQPLPVPPVASVGREDPAPRPVRDEKPPAAAAERPGKSALLGWLNRASAMRAPKPAEPPPAAPTEPTVDLGPLTRVPDEPAQPAAPIVAAPAPPPPPPKPAVAPSPRPAPKPATPAPSGAADSTVYKSGVIDGMAYTLFMDGAIEAELPQGRVRFGSVDELQKYLTSRSRES